ncbi:MAG TPA: tyrosine-type recombinase/integrase [Jatrophihabitantaceae bacterium]
MAGLSYRRNGWELRYREPSGVERTERFRGRSTRRPPEAALDRKAEVERDLRRCAHVPREAREVRFEVYFDQWWATRQVSRTREYTDKSRARLHVLPHWGRWRLCDIRPSDVDDWIAGLGQRMGPIAVRHCYTLLRGPIRRAVKDRVIPDPLIDIALPAKPKIRKSFDDVLTRDQARHLVASVADTDPAYATLKTNGRYQALIFMGCWLGPRWNEAIGLRVCDLNPLHAEISFGRVVVNENGGHTFQEALNKTEEYRTVPCASEVMNALLEHIARYCPGTDRERFLFLSRNGTHPLRSNFRRDVLKPALRRAGLGDRHITWLSLRHTAASLMFDAGLTIFEVQERLGHHSPTVTSEVYTHLMRERHTHGRALMETYMHTPDPAAAVTKAARAPKPAR